MRALAVLFLLLWASLPSSAALPAAPVAVPARAGTGFAQLCPVSETEAWTARHVPRLGDTLTAPVQPIVFESAGGGPGTAVELYADRRRDLSYVRAEEGLFPVHYARASAPPSPGEEVYLVGYDELFRPNVVRAKVTAVFAGTLAFDRSPGPGSSGSCVVSVAEVPVLYAVNSGGRSRGTAGELTGLANGVWGAWGEVPERWRYREGH